jgi:hypothetical protein
MVMGRRALLWALALLMGGVMRAAAAELKLDGTSVTEDGPRVTLRLKFSGEFKYELIAQYAKNQIILHIPGLAFSKQQLKSGLPVGAALGGAVRGGAYEAKDTYGEIRLQLVKGITPGDVQLIPKDKTLDLQFVIPGKAGAANTFVPDKSGADPAKPARTKPLPADEPAEPLRQTEDDSSEPIVSLTGQSFVDPPLTIATADPGLETELAVDPSTEPDEAPIEDDPVVAASTDEPEHTTSNPASEPINGGYSPDELAEFSGLRNPGGQPAEDPEPAAESAPDESGPAENAGESNAPTNAPPPGGPSYKRFDLDQVPAKQVEIRDLPFREALLQLVAGSGFNVVVGSNIDNESVYLNFKNKQISLKEALETLCIAYQLAYTVEDGAIVVTRQ